MRLDSVALTSGGGVILRQGEPRAAAPAAPPINAGERYLGNIYLPASITKLEPDDLFPILERAYPERPTASSATITRIVRRLNAGQPFRILAWGDSVTESVYSPRHRNGKSNSQRASAHDSPKPASN